MSEEIKHHHEACINELCMIVNSWATEKGWNETSDSVGHKAEQIALMHSELSECLEYVRTKEYLEVPSGEMLVEGDLDNEHGVMEPIPQSMVGARHGFPSRFYRPNPARIDEHIPIPGEHAELADLAIRLFHYCGRRGINLGEAVRMKHAYNINRPYRHGKNL